MTEDGRQRTEDERRRTYDERRKTKDEHRIHVRLFSKRLDNAVHLRSINSRALCDVRRWQRVIISAC